MTRIPNRLNINSLHSEQDLIKDMNDFTAN